MTSIKETCPDEAGNFIETRGDVQTTHGPTVGNMWSCDSCGAEAKVEYHDA